MSFDWDAILCYWNVYRLPTPLHEALTCIYGDRYDPDCDVETTPESALASCKLLKDLKLQHARCHLEAWNRYEHKFGNVVWINAHMKDCCKFDMFYVQCINQMCKM
jgi:hypothetical protein